MNTTLSLSANAAKLLAAIKGSNLWEDNATKVLFPQPKYSKERAADYWQHEVNTFGYSIDRPVNGVQVPFKMNIEQSYSDITHDALVELRNAGLVKVHNAGYNTYYYQYTGK
jgi:hypothetical protein